jgi:hypothetical protein
MVDGRKRKHVPKKIIRMNYKTTKGINKQAFRALNSCKI